MTTLMARDSSFLLQSGEGPRRMRICHSTSAVGLPHITSRVAVPIQDDVTRHLGWIFFKMLSMVFLAAIWYVLGTCDLLQPA